MEDHRDEYVSIAPRLCDHAGSSLVSRACLDPNSSSIGHEQLVGIGPDIGVMLRGCRDRKSDRINDLSEERLLHCYLA